MSTFFLASILNWDNFITFAMLEPSISSIK